ncbi:MAG: hypothetical protein KIT43_07030 [Bauldia sp.]|nr:hypothetical protein [Bauldia sp.]MCW5718446.1 hypothetical protein [Bauldia sp.]
MSAILELRRLLTPVLLIVMFAGALWTYQTKHYAVEEARYVNQLRDQIEDERVRLSLLKAEWSELTQPGRLQQIVEAYPDRLGLQPFGISRMVRITDIPFAPDHDFIADMVAANNTNPGQQVR